MEAVKMFLVMLGCVSVWLSGTQAQTSGSLRLVGSSTGRGRLEIYYFGEWGTVCDDLFGLTEANVACRQLGFTSASRYGSVGSLGFSQASFSTRTWLDNVDCSSFDTRLGSCRHNGIGVENCGHSEDIGLICVGTSSTTPSSGDLRLVSSFSSSSTNNRGRLEIYLRGEWGTVCNDFFGQTEADVACRQLGFNRASSYGTVGQLGYSQPSFFTEIWLDNVDCSSSDTRLLSCDHNGIGVENCGHSEDIALICSDSGTINIIGLIVGVTVAGVFLTIVVPIGVVLVVLCCRACAAGATASRRGRAGHTGNTVSVPASAVVTTKQGTEMGTLPQKGGPPPNFAGYPPQPYPGYPPQQQQAGQFNPAAYPPQQQQQQWGAPQQGTVPPPYQQGGSPPPAQQFPQQQQAPPPAAQDPAPEKPPDDDDVGGIDPPTDL